jgi:poly(hydroxyalkanoate) depolymerase family esterase
MVLAVLKKGSNKMKSIFDGALRKVTARTPLHDLTEATKAIQTALAGQDRGKHAAGSKKAYGANGKGPAERRAETVWSGFAPPNKASEPLLAAPEGIQSTRFAEAWRPNSQSESVKAPEDAGPSNPVADLMSAFSAFQEGLAFPGSLTGDAHQASPMGEVMEMLQRRIVPGWGLPIEPEIIRERVVETPEGAQFLRRTYTSDAGSRDYKLLIPSGAAAAYARAERLPLIVMLHGCKQDPDDFALGTGMNKLAQERGFLVAYPEQSARANQMACWNWFNVKNQERESGEPSIIAGIASEIMSEFDVDPDLVFVAGLSAGGAMAAILGATYPDLFKATGIHSGLPCGAATDIATAFIAMRHGAPIDALSAPETNVRTIVFQGGADRTVHPTNADLIVAFARAGLDRVVETKERGLSKGVAYERTIIADSSGEPQIEYWAIEDMGHAWSGGNREGSFTDPYGPDASREMLRFFLDHRARKKKA